MNLNLTLVKKPLPVLRKKGWGGLSFRGFPDGWSFLWTHPGGDAGSFCGSATTADVWVEEKDTLGSLGWGHIPASL